jgi:hypothetical protein
LAGGLDAAAVDALIASVLSGFAATNVQMGVTRYALTVAERQNLIAAPVTIVPAIGGVILLPIAMVTVRTTAATPAVATGSATIRWQGHAFNLTTTWQLCESAAARNNFDLVGFPGTVGATMNQPATVVGTALQVQGFNNQVGGAGSTYDGWLWWAAVRP